MSRNKPTISGCWPVRLRHSFESYTDGRSFKIKNKREVKRGRPYSYWNLCRSSVRRCHHAKQNSEENPDGAKQPEIVGRLCVEEWKERWIEKCNRSKVLRFNFFSVVDFPRISSPSNKAACHSLVPQTDMLEQWIESSDSSNLSCSALACEN